MPGWVIYCEYMRKESFGYSFVILLDENRTSCIASNTVKEHTDSSYSRENVPQDTRWFIHLRKAAIFQVAISLVLYTYLSSLGEQK